MVVMVVALVGYCGLVVVFVVLIIFVSVAFVVVTRELWLSGCSVMVVLILVGL